MKYSLYIIFYAYRYDYMLYFKNEKIPTLHHVFPQGCNIKKFINCDRSKLLELLK